MEKKKPTKAQIENRIKNAIVFIPKDKDYSGVYFADKGLRLEVTQDSAIVSTTFHRHVFDAYTSSGFSRPYLYTKRIIEIALENDCKTENGYSYAKLLETLKAKEDKAEFNVATYFSWYLYNIFSPLYTIGENEMESFIVYLDYVYGIAKNAVLLAERTEDVTDKSFVEAVLKNFKEFTEHLNGRVLLPKLTDEEFAKQQMEAMAQDEHEQAMGGQA